MFSFTQNGTAILLSFFSVFCTHNEYEKSLKFNFVCDFPRRKYIRYNNQKYYSVSPQEKD